jgi:hypothetical protein
LIAAPIVRDRATLLYTNLIKFAKPAHRHIAFPPMRTGTSLADRRESIANKRRFSGKVIVLCALSVVGLMSGCASVALKHSFDNYSDTYAETQNRQMLLNLARLSNREPIYFFQLTQILAGYTFTETASIGDSHERGLITSPATNFRTATASLGGTATHNPTFTLVPLGGDKFATQLLAPIKPEIFYELFEEGWPVDLLMRVLIERMELVLPAATPAGANKIGTGEQLEMMVNNPLEQKDGHYDRFLRACALARTLQKKGILYLDISKVFVPLADETIFASPPTEEQQLAADKQGLIWKQTPSAESPSKAEPPAKSQVAGAAEHASEQVNQGSWQLGREVTQTLFKLNSAGLEAAAKEIGPDTEYEGKDNLIKKFNLVVTNGIGVTGSTTAKGSYNVRLVMRSLMGVMLALANEQQNYALFDDFRTRESEGWDHVPRFEDHPALQLIWPGSVSDETEELFPSRSIVASLDYKNVHYSIEDRPGFVRYRDDDPDRGETTWNRDVFRLIVQLSLQVTADPSNFAQPLLQTH